MSTTPDTCTQLHEIREQRRISAAQLAKVTGVSRQTIYAIEAGEYIPNTTLALQLARILEVRVEDLFRLEAEPTAPAPPVTVHLIGATELPRKGQPVRLCRVGKQMIGVPAIPQPAMLPMADGVIVDNARHTRKADVHVFQSDPDEG